MKKKSTQDRILLAQSGELSPRKRKKLERELEQDPAYRAYGTDLDNLTSLVRDRLPPEEASDFTMQRLRAVAEKGVPMSRPAHATPSWRPALAYGAAAVILLASGLFYVNRLRQPATSQTAQVTPDPRVPPEILDWDGNLDEEIEALDKMMAMAFGDETENGSTQESLEDLAEELIELEGIQI